jgi:hypothetical protein
VAVLAADNLAKRIILAVVSSNKMFGAKILQAVMAYSTRIDLCLRVCQEIRGDRVGVRRTHVMARVAEFTTAEIVDLARIKRGGMERATDWYSTEKGTNFDIGEGKEMGGVSKPISLQAPYMIRTVDIVAMIAGDTCGPQRRHGAGWWWPSGLLGKHLLAAVHPPKTVHPAAVSSDQVIIPKRSKAVDTVRVRGISWNNDPFLKGPIPLRHFTMGGILANVDCHRTMTTKTKAGAELVIALKQFIQGTYHAPVVDPFPRSISIYGSQVVVDHPRIGCVWIQPALIQAALSQGVPCQLQGIKRGAHITIASMDSLAKLAKLPGVALRAYHGRLEGLEAA